MQTALIHLSTAAGAYLLGSISFAVVVSRMFALPDPRTYGSGNPGATNVLRTGKKAAAALTLLGDAGKGWAAVFLAQLLTGETGIGTIAVPLAGAAAFLGHLFPVFHRFQGGKGVATACGVLFGFNLWLGLGTLVTWILVVAFFRLSSLAALVAALFAPAFAFWLFGLANVLWAVALIALLLVWRHRANIARLVAGEESRIGAKSRAQR
jgi:glycerol-3-phosphate acyltransferase PlsY